MLKLSMWSDQLGSWNFQLRASPCLLAWSKLKVQVLTLEHAVYHRFIKSAELITQSLCALFSPCCYCKTTAAQKSNAQVNRNYHFIIAARYFLFSAFCKSNFFHSLCVIRAESHSSRAILEPFKCIIVLKT